MPGSAVVYYTDAITDASPDHTAETVIATIADVAANPYGSHAAVEVTVGVTPGTSTTAVSFNVRQNSATGTAFTADPFVFNVTAAVAAVCSFVCQAQLPIGVGSLVVTIQQADASADATITAVTAVALVGQ